MSFEDLRSTVHRPFRSLRAAALAPVVASLLLVTGCSSDDDESNAPASLAIQAPDDAWTWVDFDNAFCGTGTTTGIAVNPSSASNNVIVWLQDGGVCYTPEDCLDPDGGAANFTGFGPPQFNEWGADRGVRGIFDRADPSNPFKDYSFVFVPYCTGDFHAGNKISNDDLHHVGHANITAYLERLVPTFPSPDTLVVAGSSAGAFGTWFNLYQIHEAFQPAQALLINDSGPFFPFSAYVPDLVALVALFGLKKTVPPGCDKCIDIAGADGGPHQFIPYYATALPNVRGSITCSLADDTLPGYMFMTQEEFAAGLNTLADETVPLNPNFRVFFPEPADHVWLFGADNGTKLSDVTAAGVTLDTFLSQQLSGDAGWVDVRP